ncbi:hypothetical protein JVU11DRAFT_6171 [Chiua virens]|nr:hypothetical protein JVU11DRAFT_6171 [Chiua virens]
MSSDNSNTDPRSPPYGTATFTSFTNSQSMFSPSRYSYTSSDTPLASSDSDDATSDRRMRRVNVSPTRSANSYDSYSDENSIEDRAEVEAALTDLDNEFNSTEDMLTEWSRSTGPSYTTTPSYSTSLDTYSIYNRDGNRLSTITERTENIPSRPVSYQRDGARPTNLTSEGHRLSAHPISIVSPGHLHSRSVTDLTSDRPVGKRTGHLIAFFEDRASPSDTSFTHSRTSSMPGNRVHSPLFPHSQSTPYMSSTTGHGYTTTGYGTSTGYASRPSSPAKSKTGSAISSASDSLSSSSLLAPPTRGLTGTTTQLTPSDFASAFTNTFAEARSSTNTSAVSPTVSSLRRPQTSPRSPLTSVRNIVEAWKERTSVGKATKASTESSVSVAPKPDGRFGLRRRTSRVERQPASESADNALNLPTTPKSISGNIIPPPFEMTELGAYARDSREPLRKGDLWYLNVHSGPPYRWQRCEALLYPHMLLLSWIAPGGGRGVVTLDLVNCIEVRSVPSPNHPSAREDVGTIAARAQVAEGNSSPLLELLCPFQLLYGDGVERLAAESARERVRWVSAIWEALDRSITLPNRSLPGSPAGSIRTIRSMSSVSGTGSGSGSASIVFVPPLHTIPSVSDLLTISDSSSTGSLSRAPSFPPHHRRTTDDIAVANQSYIYPGDPRVIAPSRSSSLLSRARNAKPGLGFGLSLVGGVILGDGSPVTVSSGPRLSGEVRVTPPPSGKAKTRPLSEISDDNFFSADSTSSSSSDRRRTTTGIITDETAFEFTSGGSNTQIVPSTLSYRRTESNSYLGDSHDGSYTYSNYTSSSPSSLSRSPGIRRRRYSRSYVSEKENATSGYTASQSRSTLSSWTRSRSTTPTPAPSTTVLSTLEIPDSSGSEGYETANSPSTASFKSLPSIPSETDYATVEQCKTEVSTEFHTVNRCISDLSSEYATAEKCKTEASTDFYTAEKCKTETETDFITAALCECERTEQSETHYETASLCKTIPSEASTPRSLVVDLPVETVPSPPKPPSEPVSVLPPVASPSISSASREAESEHYVVTELRPTSIMDSGELSISLPSTVESSSVEEEESRMASLSSTESSEFVMSDIPVSVDSLQSPAPLATTESSPSIHPSQWASETDISYESSQLQPTPLTQSLHIQEGRDTSDDHHFSEISTPPRSPRPPPPPPPPPAPVTHVSSPSSGPTPVTLTSTESSSLSRTPSTVSSVSSLSSRISLVEEDAMSVEEDIVSLADVAARSDVSTEPSLLSSLRGSSVSSVHYYPHPTMIPLPESPAPVYSPVYSPAPSPSVSVSTPQTYQPSIHSELETEPTHTHTERTEVITHEIDRLLHHIQQLDTFRGQENHEMSENIRAIRDELYDLSEYVRTHLVTTERVVVAPAPVPPVVPRRDQSVTAITATSEHRDRSVGARSDVSEPRPSPLGPRMRPGLIPIPLSPPPVRSPSLMSAVSTMSFLSSHHSDDFSLLGADEEEVEMLPSSPVWPSEPSSPLSEPTLSLITTSESSPGPTLSLTSSSSSPTPPPSSPTPSTDSTDSSITARPVPVEGVSMTTIRDMLTQLREQTAALWDGQSSTNHMLDELRQSRPVPPDNREVLGRLDHIETLIQEMSNIRDTTREHTTQRDERVETVRVSDRVREESVVDSEDDASLLSRWESMVESRRRGRIPSHIPPPRQAGPSLDEQLMELLNIPPAPVPSDIRPPPQLIPFIHQPAPRPARSRSTSPVLRPGTVPASRYPPIWSPETLHPPLRPLPRPRPSLVHPRRQPLRTERTEESLPHQTLPVVPPHIRSPRADHVSHDPPPGQVGPPERTPQVRPPGPFLPPGGLYADDEPQVRPPSAPAHLGPGSPPRGSSSWYNPPRQGVVVPPPGLVDDQQGQGQGYVPMPPGPTVVQLPLFDTLMAILREHRLAQLATVDQQRELMRYMSGLNDWLARDVQDRQAELRAVTARLDQLMADVNRLGPAGPGVAMPVPQPTQPQPGVQFIVPPPGVGSMPPVIPGVPIGPGFVPQPPVIPFSTSVHSPVIPEPPLGRFRMPEPQPRVPIGPVVPHDHGVYDDDYPITGPTAYFPEPEYEGPVIPSTPSSGFRSPVLPIPVPPSHPGSRSSTPTQASYHPPHSPVPLPIQPGAFGVPDVVQVPHSPAQPLPQTIINIPPGPLPPPPPGQVEPLIVQPSSPRHGVVPVSPSIRHHHVSEPFGQPAPIIIHPPAVPLQPTRTSSRTSTRPPFVVVPSPQGSAIEVPPSVHIHDDHPIHRSPTIHGVPLSTPHDPSRSRSRERSRRDDDRRRPYERRDRSRSRSYSPDYYRGRYYRPYDDRYPYRPYSPSERYHPRYHEPYSPPWRYHGDDRRRRRGSPSRRSGHSPRSDGDEGDRSPDDDPRRRRSHRTPRSARSDYPPDTGEHDPGDRRRPSPATDREGTATPHPGPSSAAVPPPSPVPPTIIRIGGGESHAPHSPRPIPPGERYPLMYHKGSRYSPEHTPSHRAPPSHVSERVDDPHTPRRTASRSAPPSHPEDDDGHPYPPRHTASRGAPSHEEEDQHTPQRILSRAASAGGDPHTPQRTGSRGGPTPQTPEDPGAINYVPPPPEREHPEPPLHSGPGGPELEDALGKLSLAEQALNNAIFDVQDAEGRREHEFRENEDDRERIFVDNEGRRDLETRQRADTLFHELEDKIANVPQVPPVPVPPPQAELPDDGRSFAESLHSAATEAAQRHADDIMETVRSEREYFARERESLAAEREAERARLEEERRHLDAERDAKIAALEEELARTRGELDNERQLRITEENEARMAAAERDETIRNQLVDLTTMIQQNLTLCEEKKALMDEHWAEKQRWKEERDGQMQELLGMVARLMDEQAAARQREEEQRLANEGKPGIEQVMEDLQRQNAEQRDLLNALSDSWRADSNRQHQDTLNAVRATANEQVPYNVQGYLDEFSKALATEVRMLLGEVGKLREERRNIQHELGYLMMMKSKYGPGGEFDPDWKPPMAPGPAPPPAPPPDAPPPPEEMPIPRPAWRTLPTRGSRRSRKSTVPPPPPPQEPPRQHSWVTWQPNPALAPTPPSVEPTLLVPDRGSPGLFGPRSPRDSLAYRG